MIRKRGNKWCVLSPNNPDWSGGCYRSRREAEKRLRQVERAKHARGVGATTRMCWETEERGLTYKEALEVLETTTGPIRLTYDARREGWTVEVKKPCGPAHPMRRFMYGRMRRRRRR